MHNPSLIRSAGAAGRFLLRPGARLAARLAALRAAVGWRGAEGTLGLHVRRGDRMVCAVDHVPDERSRP